MPAVRETTSQDGGPTILALGHSIRSAIKELGPVVGLMYLADRALCRLPGCKLVPFRFYAQPVPADADQDARLLAKLPDHTRAGPLAPEDPVLATIELDAVALDYRLGQGATLIGVVERGQIVGALWFCRGDYDEDEVRCRFRPVPAGRAVWDLGVHVNASHRLGRTFVRLWAAANQELRASGAVWSLSRISAFNPSSISAHERLGAVPIGAATFLCLGGLQLMVASRRPFVHISWGGAGPLLRLAAPTALR